MSLLDAAALLLTLAALFGVLNHHVLKLPFAIGLLVGGLLASFGVLLLDTLLPTLGLKEQVRALVLEIDFASTVLNGMLSLLLFAGALHTDISRLRQGFATIISLATVSVVISAIIAGFVTWGVFQLIGVPIDLVWCLAFGALISPTDPIAVLGVMKAAKAPKELETKVVGESLFNDGTGVILFTVFTGIGVALAQGGEDAAAEAYGASSVALLLLKEVGGGIALGLIAGYVCYRGLKSLEEPNLEVLMTVATVFVIGSMALSFHVSGPLAAVAAGIFIGNRGRRDAMGEETARSLDVVWTFIDEMLNAVLFLLIGLEVFAIDTSRTYVFAGLGLIPAMLLARFVSVAVPVVALRIRRDIGPGTIRALTWGGIKGGVSVALAMKLPEFEGRTAVLTITYVIVIFSIVVQGLSLGPMLRRMFPAKAEASVA